MAAVTVDRRPLLELAIDVPLWLQQDADTPYAQRIARDHLDASTPGAGSEAIERVRRWWATRSASADLPGRSAVRIRRLVTVALVIFGGTCGVAAALALFHYDGREPVNLAQVVGVFVLLQIVLALLSIALLPSRIPLVSGLQDALAELSPGAIAAALARRWLPPAAAEIAPLAWHGARARAAARFARWQAFFFSQTFGLAFNVSALVCALTLVTFTDLAFAWSTTLSVDAHAVGEITRILALPFAALAPTALPDAALIESTRFSRIEGIAALPAASGGWWPFVALCMLFWGVLPRVALVAIAAWRLHAATRTLLLDDPRVTALLDRMATPVVTQSAQGGHTPAAHLGAASSARSGPPPAGEVTAVIWSAACDEATAHERLASLGMRITALYAAGGNAAVDHDQEVIEALANEAAPRIALLCRGFEPPLLELLDFVEALSKTNRGRSLVLVLVGERGRRVEDRDLAVWRSAVDRLALSRLYVEAAG